jgi:hypothetical protein
MIQMKNPVPGVRWYGAAVLSGHGVLKRHYFIDYLGAYFSILLLIPSGSNYSMRSYAQQWLW